MAIGGVGDSGGGGGPAMSAPKVTAGSELKSAASSSFSASKKEFTASGDSFKKAGTTALDTVKKAGGTLFSDFNKSVSTLTGGLKDSLKSVGDGLTSGARGIGEGLKGIDSGLRGVGRDAAETLLGGKEGFRTFEAAVKAGGGNLDTAIAGLRNATTVGELRTALGDRGFKELADRLGMSPADLERKVEAGLKGGRSLQDTIADRMRATNQTPVRRAGLAERERGLIGDEDVRGAPRGETPPPAAPAQPAAPAADPAAPPAAPAADPAAPAEQPAAGAPQPAGAGGGGEAGGGEAAGGAGGGGEAGGAGGGGEAGGAGGAGGAEAAGGAEEAGAEDPELEKLLDQFVQALLQGDIQKVLEILQQLLPMIEKDPAVLEKLAKKIEEAIAQQQGGQAGAQGAGGEGGDPAAAAAGGAQGPGMQILQQLMELLKQQGAGAQQAA